MKIINCEQGTDKWLEARRCMITGTKMDAVNGTDWARLQLACELIAEEATELLKNNNTTSSSIERGTAEEPFARKEFELVCSKKVTELGFCISDEFPYLGISGDGWIENGKIYDEAIEIKSPNSDTSVFYMLSNMFTPEQLKLGTWTKPTKVNPVPEFKPSAKAPFMGIPADYKSQIITYFLVNSDLKRLYFVDYDPRFIEKNNQIFVVKVERDNPEMLSAIKETKENLISFREMWMKYRNIIIKDNF